MMRRPKCWHTSATQDVELPAGRALKEELLLRKGLEVYLTLTRDGIQGGHLWRSSMREAMKQSFRVSFKLDIGQGYRSQSTHL